LGPFGEDHLHTGSLKLEYIVSKDKLLLFERTHAVFPYPEEVMLSVLDMLGAMNRQIRDEVRNYFYSKMPPFLIGEHDFDAHSLIHRTLTKIGPEGRASIPHLEIFLGDSWDLDDGHSGYIAFNTMLGTLPACQSLQYFSLQLAVSHIFRNDVDPLKAFFLHGQPLCSPGLDAFAKFIASFPQLVSLHITFQSMRHHARSALDDDETFLAFALSGVREVMLWLEVTERLQGNNVRERGDGKGMKFGNVSMWMRYPTTQLRNDGGDKLGFEDWCSWHEKRGRGLSNKRFKMWAKTTEKTGDDALLRHCHAYVL